jgi:Uri superfamily endonuclease
MREVPRRFTQNAPIGNLPTDSGTYALLLRTHHDATLEVGRLGSFRLPAGLYVYVGSACGPGGIQARVNRHLRDGKRPHWHIDAFTPACTVEGVCWVVDAERLECAWVQSLLALAGSLAPIPGFGSSDCTSRCPAHLVELDGNSGISQVEAAMVIRRPHSSTIAAQGRLLEDQIHTESVLLL